MSFIRRASKWNWLFIAAFAAAFWITFRVMAAAPPPPAPPSEPMAREDWSPRDEIRDPALERMIAHWAAAAAAATTSQIK
ncbi:MAG: hypothetical protein H7X95_08730 [Deltaproteobacteria bacterium]|nr:hypothetical protein [Deltaproteobacteria bacterium]